ncbi:hypothetical protein [Paenibacillus pseudetheri]|uniref:Wadjet protein JetD C-terminal domain-containing protein n=1 Tax=Paenibacillus pseudetheri TaxID=2897682 RepID=A0ABN8FI06_9BACL|nr:hypothetical protein [Paenibacillus pseudetheri]CAH1056762.1 hypothetical protein PAECIP111894_02917 [Paenibacillus pseudetheri]
MRSILMNTLEKKFGAVRTGRSKVELDKLEKEIIRTAYDTPAEYELLGGGFRVLAVAITELVAEGYLKPIKSSPMSYKQPSIPTSYWLSKSVTAQARWDPSAVLRVQDLLDLHYYLIRPETQTQELWSRIERVSNFLRTVKDREMITIEERSLELFDQEKWLSDPEGKQFLTRVKLTLESLKCVIAREPFIYYVKPAVTVRNILIAENKSFFHSAKRLMISDIMICGLSPDMLIYGEGWKIDSSLLFLEELNIDPLQTTLLYVGDMDKAGWDIYGKLKVSYPDLNLQLALPIYEQMMKLTEEPYTYNLPQICNPDHLHNVLQELSSNLELNAFTERLLEEDLRVPQEILNYEVMVRMAER